MLQLYSVGRHSTLTQKRRLRFFHLFVGLFVRLLSYVQSMIAARGITTSVLSEGDFDLTL